MAELWRGKVSCLPYLFLAQTNVWMNYSRHLLTLSFQILPSHTAIFSRLFYFLSPKVLTHTLGKKLNIR
ncbi:hypothetical protein HTH_1032 [Hydrogenobacter thermophilus TK-6]|uniref:Uncharacterized protein n=1 Tax=Hydrogenobacter thermophilus (strain DSM 6534 / IAM 12695 / TK-6) TaxID=608538 RepID=D3DI38_HYDTT|nr:hypothetical protein HTH_1032 [Hydrogenobacter thermophilus TK-6]